MRYWRKVREFACLTISVPVFEPIWIILPVVTMSKSFTAMQPIERRRRCDAMRLILYFTMRRWQVFREVSASLRCVMLGVRRARLNCLRQQRPETLDVSFWRRQVPHMVIRLLFRNEKPIPSRPFLPTLRRNSHPKHTHERFHRVLDLEIVNLRYFNVFGPRQDPQSEYSAVIPRFVSMILSDDRPIIYGDGHQSRDFIFVRDVAKANLLAATMPDVNGSTFNVGRGESTTLLELLNSLREILGENIEPIHEPARVGDVRDSLADISEARTRLSFEPDVTIDDGLRMSVDYYRSLVEVESSP